MPTYLRIPPTNGRNTTRSLTQNTAHREKSDDKIQDVDDIILERGSRIIFILCTAALVVVHIASLILKR
jgi:hypothetical protein